MIFLFKKPKLVLDCFTDRPDVFNFSKIDYAYKFYPEWWKQTPKSYILNFYEQSTIKRCRGIIDTYKHGLMVPLWCDLSINVENKKYRWQFSDYKTDADIHESKQWEAFVNPDNYGHLKIQSPWYIKCKTDTKFYWIQPFWNYPLDTPYYILPGILDFKYNNSANINIMLDLQKNYTHTIKAYTPMAHMVPISDKEIIIKHHLIDTKEYYNLHSNVTATFTKSYLIHKKNIDNQESN